MLLLFNGAEYNVSPESVASLLDLAYDRTVEEYKKIDLATRVIFTPVARGLVKSWGKQPGLTHLAKLQKGEEPSLRLIEMILAFVELAARDITVTMAIDAVTGQADLSFYHPVLSEPVVMDSKKHLQEEQEKSLKEQYEQGIIDFETYNNRLSQVMGL